MTLVYAQKPGAGDVLYVTRLVVGSAMAAFVILGFAAARRRDFASHRASMMRAYALALGAGTQILTVGIGTALFGTGVLSHDLEMLAGWAINLALAEAIIRRNVRTAGPRRQATVRPATTSP